ncbi:MAG: hypothetical protein PHR61_02260 [Candidatus Absconditabacteria bacterium]|nr:hypothetical protein [Candidatus Absconditabacteria bacterium]
MKQIFKNNVIKFIIGIILLFFCFLYTQKYPAEKIAIFSGFEVMVQRVEIIFNKFMNDNSDSLKNKFDYEKAYEELIRIAEANSCEDPQLIQELKDTLTSLQNEPIKTIQDVMPGYIRKANELKNRVSKECKN